MKKIVIFTLFTLTFSQHSNFSNSINNFGLDLFKIINKENNSNNLISPLSLSYALLMANKGADDRTMESILSTLNLNKFLLDSIYLTIYNNYKIKQPFQITNSIWIQEDSCYIPNQNYINSIDSIFKADIFYVNYLNNKNDIINNINNWVSSKTHNTINNIISPNDVTVNTRQALINAIYFKDTWMSPFDSTRTKEEKFYKKNDSYMTKMMNKKTRYYHFNGPDFHLLEIPYSSNNISMFLLLPLDKDLDLFVENLNQNIINSYIDSLSYELGDIYLPYIKSEKTYSFKKYLQQMGMIIPFDPNAASFKGFWEDSSNCVTKRPNHYINIINHKTFINLDEAGTEASASTAIVMNRTTSINPFIEPFVFKANHPFVYIIYDKETKTNIFIGTFTGNK